MNLDNLKAKGVYQWVKPVLTWVLLVLPFLSLDIWMRLIAQSVKYFRAEMVATNILFTIVWIGLFVSVGFWLTRKAAKIVYGVVFFVCWGLFLANAIYFSVTSYFLSVRVMSMAEEGKSYIWEVVKETSPWIYAMALVSLVLAIFAVRAIKGQERFRWKRCVIVVVAFVVLRVGAPMLMGPENDALAWDTWRNPRDVYEAFIDANKNMKICGLYEYTFRDIMVNYFGEEEEQNPEDLAYLKEIYGAMTTHLANEFTGKFAGKNVIFLQLEGIDSWMLTEETMPHLYQLQQESINFTDHYSYYNGGGSTFNSEFAVNTGLVTPMSYAKNAYTLYGNTFESTLPQLFKAEGYRTNAFHMNTKEYYSRGLNYSSWGYDGYHSLMESGDYTDKSYELDRELVLNEKFYETLFTKGQPFLHYMITYTPHTPFTTEKGVGKMLQNLNYPDGNGPELDEEACAKMMAAETDYMVGLLVQALRDNGLYGNTVIVAYADHYLYTINDKSVLDKYKTTENHLINQTPFFIWGVGQQPMTVEIVNSQLDILPTVLNLFGIAYEEERYLGDDILSPDYDGLVFFTDYSWYDGTAYVSDGAVQNDALISAEEVAEKTARVQAAVRKNDLTLQYDYFKRK